MKHLHQNEFLRKQTLSDYLDGDLAPDIEREVEAHLPGCAKCNEYLNSLKMVSSSLEILLDENPPPLPENFTKKIKAAAESDISDIRAGSERIWGLGISAVLLVLVALITASNLGYSNGYVHSVLHIPMTVIDFVVSGVYKISLALSVIVGTVCSQLVFKSTLTLIGIALIGVGSAFVFSKHIRSLKRS